MPSTIVDKPTDSCSYGTRLLRVDFQLVTSAKRLVIMPSDPVTSKVSAPAMALFRKFKALSEASHFELFASYEEGAAKSVDIMQGLMAKRGVATPDIALERFYFGNRNADYDLWKA